MSNSTPSHLRPDGCWARSVSGKEIPSAYSTKIFHCGHDDCEHAHLVGYNRAGEPMFEIVLSEEHILQAFRIVDENRK